MDLGIAGEKAIIGGASADLGKACAMSLAREGAEVTLVARPLANIEAAAEEIRSATGARVTPRSRTLPRTRAGLRRSRPVLSPTLSSTTREDRPPVTSATGIAKPGSRP